MLFAFIQIRRRKDLFDAAEVNVTTFQDFGRLFVFVSVIAVMPSNS